MNVSAEEKSTGQSQKITIQNDGNKLSKEEIERMTAEAEEYAEEDRLFKEKIEACNELEQVAFGVKGVEQMPEEMKTKADESLAWLDENRSTATCEEIKSRATELRDESMKAMPQPDDGAGVVPPSSEGEGEQPGPNIEEVD